MGTGTGTGTDDDGLARGDERFVGEYARRLASSTAPVALRLRRCIDGATGGARGGSARASSVLAKGRAVVGHYCTYPVGARAARHTPRRQRDGRDAVPAPRARGRRRGADGRRARGRRRRRAIGRAPTRPALETRPRPRLPGCEARGRVDDARARASPRARRATRRRARRRRRRRPDANVADAPRESRGVRRRGRGVEARGRASRRARGARESARNETPRPDALVPPARVRVRATASRRRVRDAAGERKDVVQWESNARYEYVHNNLRTAAAAAVAVAATVAVGVVAPPPLRLRLRLLLRRLRRLLLLLPLPFLLLLPRRLLRSLRSLPLLLLRPRASRRLLLRQRLRPRRDALGVEGPHERTSGWSSKASEAEIGVHHADAVVWGPVYRRTHLVAPRPVNLRHQSPRLARPLRSQVRGRHPGPAPKRVRRHRREILRDREPRDLRVLHREFQHARPPPRFRERRADGADPRPSLHLDQTAHPRAPEHLQDDLLREAP
eukprot:31005-Pelagococcus_subviridis.AAC.1